jgi:hypothetical protein
MIRVWATVSIIAFLLTLFFGLSDSSDLFSLISGVVYVISLVVTVTRARDTPVQVGGPAEPAAESVPRPGARSGSRALKWAAGAATAAVIVSLLVVPRLVKGTSEDAGAPTATGSSAAGTTPATAPPSSAAGGTTTGPAMSPALPSMPAAEDRPVAEPSSRPPASGTFDSRPATSRGCLSGIGFTIDAAPSPEKRVWVMVYDERRPDRVYPEHRLDFTDLHAPGLRFPIGSDQDAEGDTFRVLAVLLDSATNDRYDAQAHDTRTFPVEQKIPGTVLDSFPVRRAKDYLAC